MRDALQKKQRFLLFGRVDRTGRKPKLLNPSLEDRLRIVPVYRPIEGIPNKTREGMVACALAEAESICRETLPGDVLTRYGLMAAADAICTLHAPDTMANVAKAQRRFAFEQLLYYQIAVREMRGARSGGRSLAIPAEAEKDFWKRKTNWQKSTTLLE